jgi:hypothetical protein
MEKTKKDIKKWCNFHKIPWHNTTDCHSKKSLVAEVKSFESDADFDSETKLEWGRCIIDVEPGATDATTKIHLGELNET